MNPASPLRTMRAFVVRAAGMFSGSTNDREMAEEFESHLQMQIDDNLRTGMTPAEARRQALLKTGGLSLAQENYRARRGLPFVGTLLRDLQYAGRLLRRSPGFTAVAVLSLALGIGANTAIFTIINAVMLRSLPVEDPSRLVQIKRNDNPVVTNPIWEQIRDHSQAFSGQAAYSEVKFDLADGGQSQPAQALWVSGEFFRVLGVTPAKGRVFDASDDRRGAPPLAVLSHGFWQSHFSGDPAIVGKSIRLDRHLFQIVGVTQPWFRGLNVDHGFDVAVPINCEPLINADRSALNERAWWWLRVIGRLRPGESLEQAGQRLKLESPAISRATLPSVWAPDDQRQYLRSVYNVSSAAGGFSPTGRQYRVALFTLMVIVGLVLLIACVNVANLLLARASARQREFAVRMSIGASRWRIVRQMLTESVLLASLGAAGGFLLALSGSRVLIKLISTAAEPLDIDLSPDFRVLAFTIGATLLTALLFGIAPALRATGVELEASLKEHARGASRSSTGINLGRVLVAGQVALSLILLVAAGLFLGTLRNLLTVDTGFNRQNVLVVQCTVPQGTVPKEARPELTARMVERVRHVPGVDHAASTLVVPLSGGVWNQPMHVQGYTESSLDDSLVFFNRVSPEYFAALRIPLLAGRGFTLHDDLHAPRVIILAESTARHFFGQVNALGRTVSLDGPGGPGSTESYEVIGIVGDTKYGEIEEKTSHVAFFPAGQETDPWPTISFLVRSQMPPERMIPPVRSAIGEVSREASLEFKNFETQVSDTLLRPRVVALLSAAFGLLALLLAMVGLYGVTSYSVARRKGEIGIRMALGEQRQSVTWRMLRDVLILLVAGLVLGLGVALAAGRLVVSLLYGIKPNDPLQLAAAVLTLASATVLAAYLPARRAARLDPMAALREE
jgi:predicted permease